MSLSGPGNLTMNPANNGEPTFVAGIDINPFGTGFIYAKGLGIIHVYEGECWDSLYINDLGTVFGEMLTQVEVQVRKNKTELRDQQLPFKDTGTIKFLPGLDVSSLPTSINASDTLFTHSRFIHTEMDGWVSLDDLVVGSAEQRSFFFSGEFRRNYDMNDLHVQGYGDVAGFRRIAESGYEWFILTPRALP